MAKRIYGVLFLALAVPTAIWSAACVGGDPATEATGTDDSGSDGSGSDATSDGNVPDSGADTGCGDISSSATNCGACGKTCQSGVSCSGGVCGGNDVVQVIAGGYYACALLRRGTVWCWGGASNEQLGVLDSGLETCASGPCRQEPGPIYGLDNVKQISTGGEFLCALKNDGTVWCWGASSRGALGRDPALGPADAPVQVPSLTGVSQVAGGGYFYGCAVASGVVYCWGNDFGSNLGRGTTPGTDPSVAAPTPEAVVGLPPNVVEVTGSLGDPGSTCARTDDGGVWCWGGNLWGSLGHDNALDVHCTTYYSAYCNSTATQVAGVSATALIGGNSSMCAKTAAGSLTCWGYNGLAGIARSTAGDLAANTVPTTVATVPQLSPAPQGQSASEASCAIDSTGSLWCWGDENRGELGDGVIAGGSVDAGQQPCNFSPTQPCQGIPHKITQPAAFASHKVVQVSSGGTYGFDQWSTIALLDDGSVWTWGANGNGQLGTRTGAGTDATCAGGLPCSATPAQVSGLPPR